ncbi:hypothetical protein J6590_055957 [Homalodisca vitripennis]|nr:hypothetical protein J6590_055957 [Homalodisca vitripennis]
MQSRDMFTITGYITYVVKQFVMLPFLSQLHDISDAVVYACSGNAICDYVDDRKYVNRWCTVGRTGICVVEMSFRANDVNVFYRNFKRRGRERSVVLKFKENPDQTGATFHHCLDNLSCEMATVFSDILENEPTEKIVFNPLEFFGGKKKEKKKSDTDSLTAERIGEIASKIMKEIFLFEPAIYQNNSLDDNKLIMFMKRYLDSKDENITKQDFDLILYYIKENFFKKFKENYGFKQPLFDNLQISNFRFLMLTSDERYSMDSYKAKISLSKVISSGWTGLGDLIRFGDRRLSFGENLIHPLFMILYGLKIPAFEDLSILQDYVTLLDEIKREYLNKNHTMLLLLRSDPGILKSKIPEHKSPENNENLRCTITVLLREIATSIRKGSFESNISEKLVSFLNEITMAGAKSEEENMIPILATYSFKPTLISKHRILPQYNVSNDIFAKRTAISVPTAVYDIEFNIPDMVLSFNQTRISFSDFNLKNVVYNVNDNKAYFNYYLGDYRDRLTDMGQVIERLEGTTVEADLNRIQPAVLTRAGLLLQNEEDIVPISVPLTNGFFVVHVSREQNKISPNPLQNLFYQSKKLPQKEYFNLSPIDIEENTQIYNINYLLSGVLCADFLELEEDGMEQFIDIDKKIGTFALIRTDDGWLEYNPNIFTTLQRTEEFCNRVLEKSGDKTEKEKKKLTNEIFNHKVSHRDLLISNERAKELMSKYSVFLFFKEDYETYKERIEQRFSRNFGLN